MRDRPHRARGMLLVLALAVVGLAASCATAPETPANAAVDFRTQIQIGSEKDIQHRVCSQALDSGRSRPYGYDDVSEGQYFDTGVTIEDGSERIIFADITLPNGPGSEVWAFHVIREGRTWKVCRVRRANEREQKVVARERYRPPPR